MKIPQDKDVENNILGSILIDKEAIFKVSLTSKDFWEQKNKKIFKAMCSLRDKKMEIDLVSLGAELGQNLDAIGGHSHLAKLMNLVPTACYILSKEKILKELTYRRELMDKAQKLNESALKGKGIEKSKRELLDIGLCDSNTETIADLADKYLEEYDKPIEKGIMIGIPKIDNILMGFKGGDTALIMGDTNSGKTMLLLNIAIQAIKDNKKVMIVSLEMKPTEIFQRLLVMYGKLLPYDLKIRKKEALDGIADTIGKLAEKYIKIVSAGTMSSSDIRQQAFVEQRQNGLDILLVDSLPLIRDERKAKDNLEIASKSMKALAMDLDIPVVMPVQTDKRSRIEHKEPRKEDIKDSTEPANDCSILLVVTDEDFGIDNFNGKGIWLLKHRDGEKNVMVKTKMDKHLMFREVDLNSLTM